MLKATSLPYPALLHLTLLHCCTAVLLCRRHYHANLAPEEREAVQAEWTNGDVPIIVATIAFGMGPWRCCCHFLGGTWGDWTALCWTALCSVHCIAPHCAAAAQS